MSFFNFMVIITNKFCEQLNFPKLEAYRIYSEFDFFIGDKKSTVLKINFSRICGVVVGSLSRG